MGNTVNLFTYVETQVVEICLNNSDSLNGYFKFLETSPKHNLVFVLK